MQTDGSVLVLGKVSFTDAAETDKISLQAGDKITVETRRGVLEALLRPDREVAGATVRDVLDRVFADNPRLRGYVLDERGVLRKHMSVFVDGQQLVDREALSDAVGPRSEIYVMQALSGG